MSKTEHIRILIGTILITAILSIAGLISGIEILAFLLIAGAGLYFSFKFIGYVYEQKNFPLISDDIDSDPYE